MRPPGGALGRRVPQHGQPAVGWQIVDRNPRDHFRIDELQRVGRRQPDSGGSRVATE